MVVSQLTWWQVFPPWTLPAGSSAGQLPRSASRQYLDQGVVWYVVVDPDDGTVELFERVATGPTARWTSHPVGSGTVDIMICDRYRVTVPLAALAAARGA